MSVLAAMLLVAPSALAERGHARAVARAAMAKAGHRQSVVGAAAGNVLGGFTAQQWPVVIAISKNERKIEIAGAGLLLTCRSGITLPLSDVWTNLPIHPDGSVRAAATMPPYSDGSGTSITGGTDRFSGHLNRKQATFTGVWQLQLTLQMGGQTDPCDSGAVRVSARL